MRQLILLYMVYVGSMAMTALDPSLQDDWQIPGAISLLALTGWRVGRIAFETLLWVRILAVPVLYEQWGSTFDVLGPFVAYGFFAYGTWCLAGRRKLAFALPFALPLAALGVVRWQLLPTQFSRELLDARIQATVAIPLASLPAGWLRYHCPGYSIGVPEGMTCGYAGTGKGISFAYHDGRPPGEKLASMTVIFSRITSVCASRTVAAMAAQLLGASSELEYARHTMNAGDGKYFLEDKQLWLSASPPEVLQEVTIGRIGGFLFHDTKSNGSRARLYLDDGGVEKQFELWFYGDAGTVLPIERVYQQLSTLLVDLPGRVHPSLQNLQLLASRRADCEVNIALSSYLTFAPASLEGLYFMALNQYRLGRIDRTDEAMRIIENRLASGRITSAQLASWQAQYGTLDTTCQSPGAVNAR